MSGTESDKMILTLTVVEDGDSYSLRFDCPHEHIAGCPECLALLASRIAGSFHEMIEKSLAARADEDNEDRPPSTH